METCRSSCRRCESFPSGLRLADVQVDFVASGSRFKLYMPKENTKITFVLAGIRAPRVARAGTTEKSEPYGPEAYKFASRYMQRDVEIGQSSS